MSATLRSAAVTAGLATLVLLTLWVFGSFTAVKIIVIITVWFAVLGAVALAMETGAQAVGRALKRDR